MPQDTYRDWEVETFLLHQYGGSLQGASLEKIQEEIDAGLFTVQDLLATVRNAMVEGYTHGLLEAAHWLDHGAKKHELAEIFRANHQLPTEEDYL
jgi:hypothetical protein